MASAFFAASAPAYFLNNLSTSGDHDEFRDRTGRYSARLKQAITNRQVFWIHAPYPRDVNWCTQLIKALEVRVPNLKFVVSTSSSAGMAGLDEKLPTYIGKVFSPFDQRKPVLRALATLHPEAVVLLSPQLALNFSWYARTKNIPTILLIASESAQRFCKTRAWIFRSLLPTYSAIGVQSEEDLKILQELRYPLKPIRILGNLECEPAQLQEQHKVDASGLLQRIGVPDGAPILLGTGTHSGEELLLGAAFQKLKSRFPSLFLIVAPDQIQRGTNIGQEYSNLGLKYIYRTDLISDCQTEPGTECLIVNIPGEISSFYRAATAVFLGKTITGQDGHDPTGPGLLGKALLFGPNMRKYKELAAHLVARKGAVLVNNLDELTDATTRLLDNPALRVEMGQNILRALKNFEGPIQNTVRVILDYLEKDKIYIL